MSSLLIVPIHGPLDQQGVAMVSLDACRDVLPVPDYTVYPDAGPAARIYLEFLSLHGRPFNHIIDKDMCFPTVGIPDKDPFLETKTGAALCQIPLVGHIPGVGFAANDYPVRRDERGVGNRIRAYRIDLDYPQVADPLALVGLGRIRLRFNRLYRTIGSQVGVDVPCQEHLEPVCIGRPHFIHGKGLGIGIGRNQFHIRRSGLRPQDLVDEVIELKPGADRITFHC